MPVAARPHLRNLANPALGRAHAVAQGERRQVMREQRELFFGLFGLSG